MSFSERLRTLIGEGRVSEFARQVGLGESLIRKYLKGSEPTLSRASQIAEARGCSLQWLATGQGSPDNPADAVDLAALQTAIRLMREENGEAHLAMPDEASLIRTIALYQYLRVHRLRDGELDEQLGRAFARFLRDDGNLRQYRAQRIR